MLIRTRIIIIITAVFTLTIASLIAMGVVRENTNKDNHARQMISDRAIIWEQIVEQIILRMADKAWVVTEDNELADGLKSADIAAVIEAGDRILADIKNRRLADRLEVSGPDSKVIYSSENSLFPSHMVDPQRHALDFQSGKRLRGIGNDRDRNVGISLFLPLKSGEKIIGSATISTEIDQALLSFKQAVGAEILLVNRRNRLLYGTDLHLWDQIYADGTLDLTKSQQQKAVEDKNYSISSIPFEADLSNLAAYLVLVNDVTEEFARQKFLRYFLYGGLIGLVLLCVGGLYLYLRQTLAPLGRDVEVLNALSLGDTHVEAEQSENRDEVSQMAGAINALRQEMLAFARMRRSREKQRQRQERFIRNEMGQLVTTLDGKAKTELSRELKRIDLRLEERANSALGPNQQDEDVTSSDSLGLMAQAFNSLSSRIRTQHKDMQQMIAELREALSTKTAYLSLQRELEIGQRVQLSSLPEDYPDTQHISLSGSMIPAKEVGGDFYDFFDLDSDRVAVVIADVSGKGVPAALFMATSKTTIRAAARTATDPGECLAVVNDLLIENNLEELFVTVFLAFYNKKTGEFVYANGGHNEPVLIRKGKGEFTKTTNGMALAVFDDIAYETCKIRLQTGDTLLFYTDGVTEAFNRKNEAYGNDRLKKFASSRGPRSGDMVSGLIKDVEKFGNGAEQADDITIVCLSIGAKKTVRRGAK